MTIKVTQAMTLLLRQIWSMRGEGGYFGSEADARLRGLLARGYVTRGEPRNGRMSYFVTPLGERFL